MGSPPAPEDEAPRAPARLVGREVYRIERRRAAGAPAVPRPPVGDPAAPGGAPDVRNGAAGAAGGAGSNGAPRRAPGRILVGTEGERTLRRGGHAGDRAVRIVRPRLPGLRPTAPGYVLVEQEPEARAGPARAWRRLKRFLVGAPIRSAQEVHERLTKVKGLAVFASDNISSSAYATEEIMRVLVLAGAGALALTMPITLGIVALLAVVATSYQQTIKAYPNGGGSYIVSKDNLGTLPGLVAGVRPAGRLRPDGGRLRLRRDRRRRRRLPGPGPRARAAVRRGHRPARRWATCAGSASPGRSSPRPSTSTCWRSSGAPLRPPALGHRHAARVRRPRRGRPTARGRPWGCSSSCAPSPPGPSP